MKVLPNETAYDILKFLNYDQLSCFRQVDRRFCGLINEYEEEFARKEFQSVSMVQCISIVYNEYKKFMKNCGVIEIEIPPNNFPLDDVREKWQAAINNNIRLFCVDKLCTREFIIRLINKENVIPHRLILNLPNIPKNVKEMLIIRFWLEKLFNCVIESFTFDKVIFNPELIKLLFEDTDSKSLLLHTQKSYLNSNICYKYEYLLEFIENYLSASKCLYIDFDAVVISYHNKEYSMLLFNEGKKFVLVVFQSLCENYYDQGLALCYLIINHIENSPDLSNMVANIKFTKIKWRVPNMIERTENIERGQKEDFNYVKYEIANKHKPDVKFCVYYKKMENGKVFEVEITKMKVKKI